MFDPDGSHATCVHCLHTFMLPELEERPVVGRSHVHVWVCRDVDGCDERELKTRGRYELAVLLREREEPPGLGLLAELDGVLEEMAESSTETPPRGLVLPFKPKGTA